MRHVVVVGLLSCHGLSTNFPDPQAGMRFAGASFARDHAARSQHVDLPFQLKPEGTNGTALLFGFLQTVEPSGAKYISEVSYSLQMVYRGLTVECVSKIVVDDGTPLKTEPTAPVKPPDPDEYTTSVTPWRPDMLDKEVVDRMLSCKQAATTTVTKRNVYDVDYAAEIPRNLDPQATSKAQPPPPPRVDEMADTTFYDVCKLDPTKHRVHRYAHFLAAKFAPPDLDQIRHRYSDLPLVEAAPECHRIDRVPGAPLRQHITADLHFVGTIDLHETVPPTLRVFNPNVRQ